MSRIEAISRVQRSVLARRRATMLRAAYSHLLTTGNPLAVAMLARVVTL